MSPSFDAIIIGAGHNGLVCAVALSKKGKKVLVLEANADTGGMAVTKEFAPGYKVSAVAHLAYGLHPKVYQACGLKEATATAPNRNIDTLLHDGRGEYIRYKSIRPYQFVGNGNLSDSAEHWEAFHAEMQIYSELFHSLAAQVAPRLKNGSMQDYKTLLKTGLAMRRMGQNNCRQLLRIIGMNIYDLANEHFTQELPKAAVCYQAIVGNRYGPRAPNTVYNWLHRQGLQSVNSNGITNPIGGMSTISNALQAAAEKHGAEVRTHSRVNRILIENHRVAGVETADGQKHTGKRVISNTDIKSTMLNLVGPEFLETDFVRRVRWIPMQGSTCKMHLALDCLPASISGEANDFSSRIIYAPSPDAIELASNPLKYDQCPQNAINEVTVPSYHDSNLAPSGKHVMSVLIPFIPYRHQEGWESYRQQFQEEMIEHLDRSMPGLRKSITAVETLTPADIEQQFNITGGHWHHGEMGLDRFMMTRPVAGYGQHRTPIKGLYLCGADCHPGGDVHGLAGLNAAQVVLRD